MQTPWLGITPIALVAVLFSVGSVRSEDRRETDTNFDNYKLLAVKNVAKANKVVLYEGLPHQFFEKNLLTEELKSKKTVRVQGFPFYTETLRLKDRDLKELTELFTDIKSFKPFSGYKKCGGFHPDYCLEWSVGKEVYHCLICFGCYEVKIFAPKAELYCDIEKEAYKKFKQILQPYRKQRPKSEQD